MNKAITDGLQLMPPPFAAGLGLWSSGDGTPGSPTYLGAPNAAIVPADQDFGSCLELVKTAGTQKLRHMGQTPLLPGMYLRVTARVKAIAGNLPSVRIAAWAGDASGQNVAGVPQAGPSVALTTYGEVVTVEAIIGSGSRGGVTLVWGTAPIYAHVGLDLTGANGGTVRIDDLTVEDVTAVFHRDMLDWVDVRDYGALGDGVTNDRAAFLAADAAAGGRSVLVPAGTYRIGSSLTMTAPVRFEGSVTMPESAFLALTRSYTIDAYARAFGGDGPGFRRMLQALFQFTDHVVLDLGGRRIEIDAPIDVAALAGLTGANFAVRRVLTNGQIIAQSAGDWTPQVVTSQASYATANPTVLTGVANVANIPVGALVTGTGVARETYVRARNIAAGTVELSVPPGSTAGTRTYTFTRFRYLLDFSGFGRLDRFELTDLDLACDGAASAIMLAPAGLTFRLHGCTITRPRDRAITSIGDGCQGMLIDECQFLSNEQALRAQDRTSICLNVNANDVKLRDNRAVRFAHFAVLHGSGHMLIGNHFFQGDSESPGVRRAGVVFSGINVKSLVTGNYIDNSFIEMTNEREPDPNWNNQFSFGGLTITGNIFTANDVVPSFCWIVVTPHGSGHYIQGLSVTGNTFRTLNGAIDRVDKVDTTFADLDYTRFRNIVVHGNNFNGITAPIFNPVTVSHQQNTAATVWTVDAAASLPFLGFARTVTGIVADGPIQSAAPVTTRHDMPYAQTEQGPQKRLVNLRWPVAVQGRVSVTIRVDNPA
ncbi:MAG: glycosyl hydrolase family 28-related protein [Gemmobacter sp.]